MDVFIEKIVPKIKTIQDHMFIAGSVLAGGILLLVAMAIPAVNAFWPILALGVAYGVYYFVTARNVEFEYAVTNGELDIDKIIARRKRKRIFSAHCKDFEIVASVRSSNYNEEIKRIAKRIEAVSSMNADSVYFATLNYKGEKTVVLFEPDKRMLEAFKVFIPRKVIM